MNLVCIEVTVAILVLFPSKISTNILFKCPEFEYEGDQEVQVMKTENAIHYDYLIIPAYLMSHFESTEFRLESEIPYFCDNNYEVIKINLIGSDTININLSASQPQLYDAYKYTEEVEGNFNSTVASKFYGSFPNSKNSNYPEGFMYSVENITTILNTSAYREETEQMCKDGKLSRNDVQFTPSGDLFHLGEYYRPNEYCIQSLDEVSQGIIIKKCNADCENNNTPCIPLCCHLHERFDLNVSCCQATQGSKFQAVIYDEINRRLSLEEAIEPKGISVTGYDNRNTAAAAANDAVPRPHYVTFKYHNECPDGWEPQLLLFNEHGESNINTRIHIRNNGKAAFIGGDRKWHLLDKFCITGLENAVEDEATMTMVLYYCLDETEDHGREIMWPNYLLIGVFVFASIFLLLTVIVYVLLWDKQNIHGWTIISFVTSEFFLFTFLSVSYSLSIFATADAASGTIYCTGTGVLAHFFFLSTFSWLTIINLDLWWTFKSLTPLSERSKGRKRFCLYMTFAWGVPIIVVSVGLTLQSIYKENSSNVVVPDYGNRQCFLAVEAKGVYLYYIIGILLLANFILISLTFFTIYQFKKSTRVASSSSSKSKEKSFKLFLKLVIVMGVTWIFEFILWLDTDGHGFSWTFLAVDILNVLQAVATFIIFVCKRKIINQLEQKHPSLKVITRPILKAMGGRPTSLMTSTSSKPTRSTTAGSSSVLGSRNRSQKQKVSSMTVDSKV